MGRGEPRDGAAVPRWQGDEEETRIAAMLLARYQVRGESVATLAGETGYDPALVRRILASFAAFIGLGLRAEDEED